MGAQQSRNQKRSVAIVDDASSRIDALAPLDDAAVADKARSLTAGGELTDPAEFLAVLAVASQRSLGLTPFPVQSKAV
ncbi:MAG: accessory Sec system translocase SecA2, partial [Corynebacterium sp.]|nr:accessory Sec system translocase SecA2 [Corynebacterium sp.]